VGNFLMKKWHAYKNMNDMQNWHTHEDINDMQI